MNVTITVRIREVRKAKGLPTLPILCRIAVALEARPEELFIFTAEK